MGALANGPMDTRLEPGRVFLDVGAWIGPLTIFAGRDERQLVRGRLELVSWTNVHSAMFACTSPIRPDNLAVVRQRTMTPGRVVS